MANDNFNIEWDNEKLKKIENLNSLIGAILKNDHLKEGEKVTAITKLLKDAGLKPMPSEIRGWVKKHIRKD